MDEDDKVSRRLLHQRLDVEGVEKSRLHLLHERLQPQRRKAACTEHTRHIQSLLHASYDTKQHRYANCKYKLYLEFFTLHAKSDLDTGTVCLHFIMSAQTLDTHT